MLYSLIYIYTYIYNGICLEKQIWFVIGSSIYIMDSISILFIMILILIYTIIFISLVISILSYDIISFIIYYEFILIPISILIISSGSLYKKEGIILLLYILSILYFNWFFIYNIIIK